MNKVVDMDKSAVNPAIMGNPEKKIGQQTLIFPSRPVIASTATIAGPKEGEGKLGNRIDRLLEDNLDGQSSWEKTEPSMLEWALREAAGKAGGLSTVEVILAGDLLNQLMATHFGIRNLGLPFLGLYGACSTFSMGLLLAGIIVDGGFANKVAIGVSSHHNTAERQYRFPTELGVQRPPVAQWTVTGAGAVVLAKTGEGPAITCATIGKIIDMGETDPNAMGPAMAPAAADTIAQHLLDTGRDPKYYDLIATGDLGTVGKTLLIAFLKDKGVDISHNYEDCGCMIYHKEQDVHAGASGCACSALVFCAEFYRLMRAKAMKRLLLVATGSLHSPTSYQQKETIPCIAHAISIEI